MAESSMDRFRRMMDNMQFETLPLFSKPHFSWGLKTDYVGRRFVYRPESDSTMDDARRMLERFRLTSGAVMLAETQREGRGRAGRSWVSPPDVNLYFTVVMFSPPEQSRHFAYVAPLATALAIEEAAAKSGAEVSVDLKWPNDVQIEGRKVAGVLIETTENQEGAPVALVGVGVNVNLDVAAYPEIAGIATSLKDAFRLPVAREDVLAYFCNHFEALHEEAASGSRAPFEAWRERLITLGREVVASGEGEPVRGRALDVADDGALIIETPDGRRVRVEAGDVTLSGSGSPA